MDLGFTVNQYDQEGGAPWDYCVLLHVGSNVILRFKDSVDIEDFADRIKGMLPEIRKNEE